VQRGRFFEQCYGLPAATVTTGLEAREALGSTGLGQGVAVPHGQIKGPRRTMALYVRPPTPIPFDATDGKPVSDVIMLLLPEWANGRQANKTVDGLPDRRRPQLGVTRFGRRLRSRGSGGRRGRRSGIGTRTLR
jgi:hypothetical protein